MSIPASKSMEKTPGGKAFRSHSVRDDLRGKFAGAGVRGMSLHNDRAARGESRSGIATRNRKGKREVAGPEDRYRAQGAQHRPNVRAWQGLAIWKSRIDSRIHPRAFLDHSGKHAQLVRGAAHLTKQAGHGQRRLQVRSLGQLLFCRVESVGNAAQKRCAGFAGDCK